MNVIYNSENYYIVEYPENKACELVDKRSARGCAFDGESATNFISALQRVAAESSGDAEVLEDYLGGFYPLMNQAVVYH